ncbi:MAG: hypothetical protein N4A68_05470 [Maledivibacter sp.]|jgi:hypothetical protein|nr:hypothetical protein [Maledivibacter sp.]
MKNKKVYLIIVLAVLTALFFIYASINYKINVINETKDDVDKITKIKKFQDHSKIQEEDEKYQKHRELSGGIEINEIFIDGSHELYNYYNFEKQKIIKERINEALLIWIPRFKKLEENKAKEFYQENEMEIANRFSCDTLEKFERLLKEIKTINNFKIKGCSIDLNTIKSIDNATKFNLKVEFEGSARVFKIRVIEDILEIDNITKDVFNVFLETM